MTNQSGMHLPLAGFVEPIAHIPAERTRAAALTVAEAGMNVWQVEDIAECLAMLGLNRQTIDRGMFGENDV